MAANTDRWAWVSGRHGAPRPGHGPTREGPGVLLDSLPTCPTTALLSYGWFPAPPHRTLVLGGGGTLALSGGRPGPLTLLHEGGVGTAMPEARGLGSPTTASRWCTPPESERGGDSTPPLAGERGLSLAPLPFLPVLFCLVLFLSEIHIVHELRLTESLVLWAGSQ